MKCIACENYDYDYDGDIDGEPYCAVEGDCSNPEKDIFCAEAGDIQSEGIEEEKK